MSPELTKAGRDFATELDRICQLPEPERTQAFQAFQRKISEHFKPAKGEKA